MMTINKTKRQKCTKESFQPTKRHLFVYQCVYCPWFFFMVVALVLNLSFFFGLGAGVDSVGAGLC